MNLEFKAKNACCPNDCDGEFVTQFIGSLNLEFKGEIKVNLGPKVPVKGPYHIPYFFHRRVLLNFDYDLGLYLKGGAVIKGGGEYNGIKDARCPNWCFCVFFGGEIPIEAFLGAKVNVTVKKQEWRPWPPPKPGGHWVTIQTPIAKADASLGVTGYTTIKLADVGVVLAGKCDREFKNEICINDLKADCGLKGELEIEDSIKMSFNFTWTWKVWKGNCK